MKSKNIYLYLIGAGITYFFIVRPIFKKLGITKTAQEIEQEKKVETYLDKTIKSFKPSKSEGEWQIIANQIFRDLGFSAASDNKKDAVFQLCRVKNEGDVALLIKSFGKRQETWFGIIPDGSEKDLQQFVTSNLSVKDIAVINNNYIRKNIKYRF
jgi:hypothetical protein